jgi:hypothetical protein
MPSSTLDTSGRIVNAIVVLGALIVAGLAILIMAPHAGDDKFLALFGSFTTLIGTALAAYFGISATRDVASSASAQVADAHQNAADAQGKLKAAQAIVNAPANGDPGGADAHPALATLRSVLNT